jgi:DNA polymerase III alpha subunit (gram-positive type)
VLVRLDAADRLVREVEQRRAIPVAEATRVLLALEDERALRPARAVLERAVLEDARLELCAGTVRLAPSPLAGVPVTEARFCVLDLETSGLSASQGAIAEIGAVVLERGDVVDHLEILGERACSLQSVRRLFRFARRAVVAGHNLAFDVRFLEEVTAASAGERIAAPRLDTLVLARRLLGSRVESFSLAALADFFGTSVTPCHRALPDALATAEILTVLLDLAGERGARTVADVCALARTRSTIAREGRRSII